MIHGDATTCVRCGEEYSLDAHDLEPTRHCHDCAHLAIDEALNIAFRYSQIDGAHRKAWAIDQMVRALTGYSYDEWASQYKADGDDPDAYEWNVASPRTWATSPLVWA